ncbi:MAG: FMN-binding protein [Patescibacteria group bacterium]|mgnify:CR=1 FL=1
MIKKVLLTIFVIATFAVYSFQQRQNDTPAITSTATKTTKTTQTITPTTTPATTPAATPTVTTGTTAIYKDGQYTGSSEDAFYGFVQVKAVISGGRLVSVEFLTYPNSHRNSEEINKAAMPILQQEAIKAQSSKVDIVSGATDTAQAFTRSLETALSSAKAS